MLPVGPASAPRRGVEDGDPWREPWREPPYVEPATESAPPWYEAPPMLEVAVPLERWGCRLSSRA